MGGPGSSSSSLRGVVTGECLALCSVDHLGCVCGPLGRRRSVFPDSGVDNESSSFSFVIFNVIVFGARCKEHTPLFFQLFSLMPVRS